MVEKLFYEDVYARECRSAITKIDENTVELATTVFYPAGGGQPGDSGVLTWGDQQVRITDARYNADRDGILHFLESMSADLEVGTTVKVELDWNRRLRHMRIHTAMHLLCSLVPESVTGGSLSAEQGRLDFDVQSSELDKERLTRELNALVEKAIPVRIESISESELDANPDLVRTMSVKPPRGHGDIRMVRVEETDFQPCGGTHVINTGEIGRLMVSKIRSKGKHNKRIILQLLD